jgi:Ala-tRNA(Pro) deacylase
VARYHGARAWSSLDGGTYLDGGRDPMQGDDEFVVRIECTVGPGGLSDFRGEGEGSIMATITWIKSMLDRRGIAYEELHHRVAFSAQEVAQREHVSGHRVAKVVVVVADGRPVELILPASRRVVLGRVEELLGAVEARLASEAEMERIFTDCETGAIPPLRHWKDVEVIMDASMPGGGDLVFQAGTHEDVIRLKFRDWFELVQPLVGAFSEPEHAAHPHNFTDRGDAGTE